MYAVVEEMRGACMYVYQTGNRKAELGSCLSLENEPHPHHHTLPIAQKMVETLIVDSPCS